MIPFIKVLHLRLLLAAALPMVLGSCASPSLETFKDEQPQFKPEEFFSGHTRSWGTFETRSGKPTKIIETKTMGRWDGSVLLFEQDIFIAHKKKSHRTWVIRKLDDHHYSATGTGIVGTARGEARGNAFHLEFTLDALPGNPLGRVHMSQWMYLQADGLSMINRATISKAGVTLTEITEHFRKDKG